MNLTLPSVSVVIPTFRRPETLERTLNALSQVSYDNSFEIIVVDDGSGDTTVKTVEGVRDEHPHLVLRPIEQKNAGAASARNTGARAANGEVIVFLDDDMLVEPDHLVRHIAHLNDPEAKRVTNGAWEFAPEVRRELESSSFGRFRLWLETWIKNGIEMEPVDRNLSKPSMLTACTLGIRRKDFLDLGGFDESFPAAGYEDQDFSVRAARAGFNFIYDKRIVLSHLDQRTSLSDFSRRIRQGAFTAGILAGKYPEEFGTQPLIVENAPASRRDGLALLVKKFLKAVLATPPGRSMMKAIIWLLDHLAPKSELTQRAYWTWSGIWIRLGVRDALRGNQDG